MAWNWEQPGWPDFTYKSEALEPLERQFLHKSGEFVGVFRHMGPPDQDALKVELLSDEAIKTSAIEGEILNRDSVQSSIQHQLGFGKAKPGIKPAERGISQVMVDLYCSFDKPLDDKTMFGWHSTMFAGSRDISVIGGYRIGPAPMRVTSGPEYKPKVHFEAPPFGRVPAEMKRFVRWFNETAPAGKKPLPALTRAALAHLYFVCIHPFEDGNGRIGRALSEKSLAQNLAQPSLIALAYTIERKRKDYYAALGRNNKGLEITDWLKYFASTIVEAQDNTLKRVEFYLAKAKFLETFRGKLNERQDKVVARMFKEGIDGFEGGLSAENYIGITKTSRATATRDLQDLVEKDAFSRAGVLRHTRYRLKLPVRAG